MTEGLVAALQDQGRKVLWLRLNKLDCDPACCLLDIINATRRLVPHTGTNTILDMQRLPGPVFGWSRLFDRLAEDLGQNLPAHTALVFENLQELTATSPALIRQISRLLDGLPSEMSRFLISNQDLPPELLVDWNAAEQSEFIINIDSCREAVQASGIQLSDRCLQRAVMLTGGSAVIFSGILDACNLLGSKYIESLVENASSQEMLCGNIAKSWLSGVSPEELYRLCLLLEIGCYHPSIGQAVCGHCNQKPGPWSQPLQDDWQHLQAIWQVPLKRIFRIDAQVKRELLLSTANYVVKEDALNIALPIYLRLNEFTRASKVLKSLLDEMMNTGQWLNLKSWLNKIPEHVLSDWPWLIHARGEMQALIGDESRAYTDFSTAKNLFSQQGDNHGLSYSLMGISTLDARRSDLSGAMARAIQLKSLVEQYELKEQQVWADLHLGLLSANANQLSEAAGYLSLAGANISDSTIAALIEKAQAYVYEYSDLLDNREHHLQELKKLDAGLQEITRKMKMFWRSKTDILPALLEQYGWLYTPLILKLTSPDDDNQEFDGSNELPLLKRVLEKFGLHTNHDGINEPALPIIQEFPLPLHSQFPITHKKNSTSEPKALIDQPETIPQPTQIESVSGSTSQKAKTREEKLSKPDVPKITVYCLGPFRVYQDEQPVEEWISGKGKAIFKYLVTHRKRPVAKEILMDLFWPDNDSDAARNNLNVAVYGLRQTLRLTHHSYSHVIFQEECYLLNPEIDIWLDNEEFMEQITLAKSLEQAGELDSAIEIYNNAESLFLGEFMEEDRYEDWPIIQRQAILEEYMKLLTLLSKHHFDQGFYNPCITICRKMLVVDPCREEAHRLMMKCFHLQGQPYLALRQYHQCVESLKIELQVPPSVVTSDLYENIRSQQ